MLVRILRKDRTYAFDPRQRPVVEVGAGQTIVFETTDCFDGQVRRETDVAACIDMTHINPNTGPVGVRGARPGDVLVVRILDIEPDSTAVGALIPGAGLLQDEVPGPRMKICPVRERRILFSDDVVIEPRLMIGTIGTTPPQPIPTGLPGDHGGNLDVPMIGIGSTVYLPVFVPGALFQLGDVHAAMGDGECSVTGMECGAEVKVEIAGLLRGRTAQGPVVETAEKWGIIASTPTLEGAVRLAVRRAASFLTERIGVDSEEAAILVSVACDARIAQWADAKYDAVAYVQIPKSLDRKGRLDSL